MAFKGHSRLLEMSRFDRARMISYYRSIVTMAISCTVFHIYTPPIFNAPVGVTQSEFRKDVQYWENQNDWAEEIPERDRRTDRILISRISIAVLREDKRTASTLSVIQSLEVLEWQLSAVALFTPDWPTRAENVYKRWLSAVVQCSVNRSQAVTRDPCDPSKFDDLFDP